MRLCKWDSHQSDKLRRCWVLRQKCCTRWWGTVSHEACHQTISNHPFGFDENCHCPSRLCTRTIQIWYVYLHLDTFGCFLMVNVDRFTIHGSIYPPGNIPPNGKFGKSSTQNAMTLGGYVVVPWRVGNICSSKLVSSNQWGNHLPSPAKKINARMAFQATRSVSASRSRTTSAALGGNGTGSSGEKCLKTRKTWEDNSNCKENQHKQTSVTNIY